MCFFFFNDTATTEIYTLSLHDALPISSTLGPSARYLSYKVGQSQAFTLTQKRHDDTAYELRASGGEFRFIRTPGRAWQLPVDRKSTRRNSSHANISYAVFCLKKKKNIV